MHGTGRFGLGDGVQLGGADVTFKHVGWRYGHELGATPNKDFLMPEQKVRQNKQDRTRPILKPRPRPKSRRADPLHNRHLNHKAKPNLGKSARRCGQGGK